MAQLVVPALAAALGGGTATAISTAFASIIVGVGTSLVTQIANKPPKASPVKQKSRTNGAIAPQRLLFGRVATRGHDAFAPYTTAQSPNLLSENVLQALGDKDWLTFGVALSDRPVVGLHSVIVQGVEFVIGTHLVRSGEGHNHYEVPTGLGDPWKEYRGRMFVQFYDGTQTEADPFMRDRYADHETRPYDADMVYQGGAYGLLTVKHRPKLWRSLNEVSWVIDATASLIPAEQAAEIAAGIALPSGDVYGLQMPFEPDDLTAAIAEIAAAGFTSGLEVQIGTPDGQGVTPLDAIEDLLETCAGQAWDDGGTLRLSVLGGGLPVVHITDDDILRSQGQMAEKVGSIKDAINSVTISHPNPDDLYEITAAPTFTDDDGVVEAGERLPVAVTMPALLDPDQAQQLAGMLVADAARVRLHTFALELRYGYLSVRDKITWSSEFHNYDTKVFQIEAVTRHVDKTMITVRETDPDDFNPENVVLKPRPKTVTTPVELEPITVAATFTPQAIQNADGSLAPGVTVAVADYPEIAESIRWQIRISGQTEIETGTFDPAELSTTIERLPNVTYEGRVKPLAPNRDASWSAWETFTTADVRIGYDRLDPAIPADITEAATINTAQLDQAVDDARDFADDALVRVAETLPTTFERGFDYWTRDIGGTEYNPPSQSLWEIVDVAGVGKVAEWLNLSGANIVPKGFLPYTDGDTYKITTELRVVSSGVDDLPREFFLAIRKQTETGAFVSQNGSVKTILNVGEWEKFEHTYTVSGVDAARLIGFVNLSSGGFGADLKVQIRSIKFEDVSNVVTATQERIAAETAAGSAEADRIIATGAADTATGASATAVDAANLTVATKGEVEGLRDDAQGFASDAQVAATASATAQSGAESAEATAVDAKDVTVATKGEVETLKGDVEALTAQAGVSQTAAATSATNAANAEANAIFQVGVAASVVSAANGNNMLVNGDGSLGALYWQNDLGSPAPTALTGISDNRFIHTTGIRIENTGTATDNVGGATLVLPNLLVYPFQGRTLKVGYWVKTSFAGANIQVGLSMQKGDKSFSFPNRFKAGAGTTDWVYYEDEYDIDQDIQALSGVFVRCYSRDGFTDFIDVTGATVVDATLQANVDFVLSAAGTTNSAGAEVFLGVEAGTEAASIRLTAVDTATGGPSTSLIEFEGTAQSSNFDNTGQETVGWRLGADGTIEAYRFVGDAELEEDAVTNFFPIGGDIASGSQVTVTNADGWVNIVTYNLIVGAQGVTWRDINDPFMTVDPSGFGAGVNHIRLLVRSGWNVEAEEVLYPFVGNSPINLMLPPSLTGTTTGGTFHRRIEVDGSILGAGESITVTAAGFRTLRIKR